MNLSGGIYPNTRVGKHLRNCDESLHTLETSIRRLEYEIANLLDVTRDPRRRRKYHNLRQTARELRTLVHEAHNKLANKRFIR